MGNVKKINIRPKQWTQKFQKKWLKHLISLQGCKQRMRLQWRPKTYDIEKMVEPVNAWKTHK